MVSIRTGRGRTACYLRWENSSCKEHVPLPILTTDGEEDPSRDVSTQADQSITNIKERQNQFSSVDKQ